MSCAFFPKQGRMCPSKWMMSEHVMSIPLNSTEHAPGLKENVENSQFCYWLFLLQMKPVIMKATFKI